MSESQPLPPPPRDPQPLWMLTVGIICLVLAGPMVLFGGWCVYDGLVTYPDRRERWVVYEQIALDPVTGQPTNAGRTAWQARAQAEGWPTTAPPETTDTDVLTQHIMAAMCAGPGFVLGLIGLIAIFLHRRLGGSPAAAVEPA